MNQPQVSGYVKTIIFANRKTGYCVASLATGTQETVTITGNLAPLSEGQAIVCTGDWQVNEKYGNQFRVAAFQLKPPDEIEVIKQYLSSGIVKGIREHCATLIVAAFGRDTFDVLEKSPHRLLKIKGIGKKRIEIIMKSWQEQKESRGVMVFLLGYGISPAQSHKIFKNYGTDSIGVVKQNPYVLAKDIHGIGFQTADLIAQKLGVEKNAAIRVEAGIEFTLSTLAEQGHTCCPLAELIATACELLGVTKELVSETLRRMAETAHVYLQNKGTQQAGIFVWLSKFYKAEKGIAAEIARLSNAEFKKPKYTGRTIAAAEKETGIKLAQNQKTAVEKSVKSKIHIITGGPGTGKSTITKIILAVKSKVTDNILLAAPTGRAAKRLSAVTGKEAKTLHSLLEYQFNGEEFHQRRENRLSAELLIIDEAGMIDTMLMYSLLRALPDHAQLILIGDTGQLPSIGAGNVLSDLIGSGKVACTRLTEIFRQATTSGIIQAAHTISSGSLPDTSVKQDSDFFFIRENNPDKITRLIADLVAERLPAKYGFDSLHDIQVLSPMRKNALGTTALNQVLQQRLNPGAEGFVKGDRVLKKGDKVMQIRNNYDRVVYNGDIGIITRIDRSSHCILVDMEGREIVYDFKDLDELMLAYAVSVHKYQGSECPCIVMPLHTLHFNLLYRNLLYTAITRGRQLVVMIGTMEALSMAVNNDQVQQRHTGLVEAITEGFG